MQLNELIDRKQLRKYLSENLVSARKHPRHPLVILNYTHAAQSLKPEEWDETLSRCRGIVYDENTEEVVATPFAKFWNFIPGQILPPPGQVKLYEKLDGSLGIGFWYNYEFIISTRGSFESEQAQWAQKWIDERFDSQNHLHGTAIENYTFLFEILYKENQIVVKYDEEGLVLLGAIHKGILTEMFPEELRDNGIFYFGFLDKITTRLAQQIPIGYDTSLEAVLAEDKKNEEGYVAVWKIGGKTHRVKLKFENYVRLAKLYAHTSPIAVWELLKIGHRSQYFHDLLKDSPEEFRKQILATSTTLLNNKYNFDADARAVYEKIRQQMKAEGKTTKKDFALVAKDQPNSDLLFMLWEYDEKLWNRVKPSNTSREESCPD